jgi:hypothetical protein
MAGFGGATIEGSSESCLKLLSLGTLTPEATAPGESGMDALVSFLNEQSNVDATYLGTQHELSSAFLSGYDVVLLQDLHGWEFTMAELEAFKTWVAAGGGVMALAGFPGDSQEESAEVLATNTLLSFTGLNFSAGTNGGDTATTIGECGYCLGTTHKQVGFNPEHPISRGIEAIGAYQGRSVYGEGDVVAVEDGLQLGVTKQIEDGRVFLFHDDWVSYVSQWRTEVPTTCEENCPGVTIESTYQMAQFWFNSIYFLAGEPSCLSVAGAKS